MEHVILVHKNTGISYEVAGVVIHNGQACYKAKPCWADSSILYIHSSEIGPSYKPDKDYYIIEPNTNKEEDLYLVKGDESYKILGICKVGTDLVYKIDLPSPQISPYSPRLSPYILKSVVDAGDYQIKRIAERDKMQEDTRINLDAIDKVDQKLRKGHYITFAKTDGVYIKLLEETQEALIYPFK